MEQCIGKNRRITKEQVQQLIQVGDHAKSQRAQEMQQQPAHNWNTPGATDQTHACIIVFQAVGLDLILWKTVESEVTGKSHGTFTLCCSGHAATMTRMPTKIVVTILVGGEPVPVVLPPLLGLIGTLVQSGRVSPWSGAGLSCCESTETIDTFPKGPSRFKYSHKRLFNGEVNLSVPF